MLYTQDATSLLHVINDMPHTMAGWGRLSECVCVYWLRLKSRIHFELCDARGNKNCPQQNV